MASVVAIAIIIILTVISKSPQIKGAAGEFLVRSSLGRNIPNERYVINNLLLYNDGRSHQIDHIVIKKTGVFVIETKNYSGRIYGSDNQREWTQVLAFGKEKHRLYNPIYQNKTHIYEISKIIGRNDCFVSIIVFPKARLMTRFDAYVGSIWDMRRWLQINRHEILTESDVEEIYRVLIDYKINPRLTSEMHIQNIDNLRRSIRNDICPRCGNKLVIRRGPFGQFYGCSGYPDCKFIKK